MKRSGRTSIISIPLSLRATRMAELVEHVKNEAKKKGSPPTAWPRPAPGAVDDKPLFFAIAVTELPRAAASAQRRRNERVLAPGNVSCGTPHPRSERAIELAPGAAPVLYESALAPSLSRAHIRS
jgi:hypothetical protein